MAAVRMWMYHADRGPQNQRIPTLEDLTPRSSFLKSPTKTWNAPPFGSASQSCNSKSTVRSPIIFALGHSRVAFPVISKHDTFRAETQNADEKSASAATQTTAMLSLNLQLQSTPSKNHAKQIELEVKTIETREVKELLTIVQVTLPLFTSGVWVFC